MATKPPDKIVFGIGDGKTRAMVLLADGTYADRTAPAVGAGLVTDETGNFTFDLGSLASRPEYDNMGNQVKLTYGPDKFGRYVQQTSTWAANNLWMGDSAWVVVDAEGNPTEARP